MLPQNLTTQLSYCFATTASQQACSCLLFVGPVLTETLSKEQATLVQRPQLRQHSDLWRGDDFNPEQQWEPFSSYSAPQLLVTNGIALEKQQALPSSLKVQLLISAFCEPLGSAVETYTTWELKMLLRFWKLCERFTSACLKWF